MAAGGKGANQAVAAARLGINVAFIGKAGQDAFGERTKTALEAEGIDCQFLFRDPQRPSGVALIVVDKSGENYIAVAPGANSGLKPEDIVSAKETIESADCLLLQLEVPLDTVKEAARIANAAGIAVILNPAPAQPLDDQLLNAVTVITPNQQEVGQLSGIEVMDVNSAVRAAELLQKRGPQQVVITMGCEGSLLHSSDSSQIIPAFKVTAVDTTAAGDAFNAGLAVALVKGLPIAESVRYANAVAALTVTKMGAQPSLPTFDLVGQFLRDHT